MVLPIEIIKITRLKGETHVGNYTDLLYARPSFTEGMARVLDLGGTLNEYNRSIDAQQANLNALRSNFCAVNHDMWCAFEQMEQEATQQRIFGKLGNGRLKKQR